MPNIDLQQAVQRATEEIQKIYPKDMLNDLFLEEIELSDSEWLVTLGFIRSSRISPLTKAMGQGFGSVDPKLRDYKRIKIDASTGDFRGMTDRRLEEQGRQF